MIRKENGFTLVELLITMIIFTIVIAAASNIFSSLLNQFKQQSKIAETNIEGIVGLDMMRIDLQQAGFGIPWNVELDGDDDGDDPWTALNVGVVRYSEATGTDNTNPTDPSYYNDGDPASAVPAPSQVRAPRALLAENNAGPVMGTGVNTWRSDYLVVKATSIGVGAAAQKWTHITNNGATNLDPRFWNDPNEDPVDVSATNRDRVIVERPSMGTAGSQQRVLITDTGSAPPAFSVFYRNTAANFPAAFQPALDTFNAHFIYGVAPMSATNSAEPLRAPFNRADFYVSRPVSNMPSQCAPNTGILYKAVMNHSNGGFQTLPLLDCVADMQVVFITDVDNNGRPEWYDANFTYGLKADQIRGQILGVVIYVLVHEGQMDRNFTFSNFSTGCAGVANCIRVGDLSPTGTLLGREFDLSWADATNFLNYRWKVYTVSVKLPNLR